MDSEFYIMLTVTWSMLTWKAKYLSKTKIVKEKAIINQHFLAKLQFCCRYGKFRENGSNTGQRRFEEGAFHKGIRGIENKIILYKMKGYFWLIKHYFCRFSYSKLIQWEWSFWILSSKQKVSLIIMKEIIFWLRWLISKKCAFQKIFLRGDI